MLTADYIKPGAVVVDVGMNRLTDRAEVDRLFADDPARLSAFAKERQCHSSATLSRRQ